jgi:hypothetical protein
MVWSSGVATGLSGVAALAADLRSTAPLRLRCCLADSAARRVGLLAKRAVGFFGLARFGLDFVLCAFFIRITSARQHSAVR